MSWRVYRKALTFFIVFSIVASSVAYGTNRKSQVVIFPFKKNQDLHCLAQGIEDVIRSELIRSGYFTVVEQERTYEFVKDAVLPNFIKIEDVNVESALPKAKIVDLFAMVDLKVIVHVAQRMKADFVVKGTLNQFGEKFRADIEVIRVKAEETLSALAGECETKEKIPELLEELSQQIVNVCKGANVQKEIDLIQNSYQQGNLTYEETLNRLRGLSSEMPGLFSIHCVLFLHYLGHQEMLDSLIEEGEEIINLFNPDKEEDIRYLATLGIDPFYELGNAYRSMQRLHNAIEVYNRALRIYPINRIKYYKQIGALYSLDGKSELAINAFQQVLSIDPADYEARLNLASVYETKGDISNAIEQYQHCLKYTRNTSESSHVKNMLKHLQGNKGVEKK